MYILLIDIASAVKGGKRIYSEIVTECMLRKLFCFDISYLAHCSILTLSSSRNGHT